MRKRAEDFFVKKRARFLEGLFCILFHGAELVQRQQMIAILYSFITVSKLDNTPKGDLDGFSDGHTTSAYARNAMIWAVDRGIINGFPDGTLAPFGSATRAQAVTIIVNFMDMYGF